MEINVCPTLVKSYFFRQILNFTPFSPLQWIVIIDHTKLLTQRSISWVVKKKKTHFFLLPSSVSSSPTLSTPYTLLVYFLQQF